MRTFASRAVFSPPYMPLEKMIGLSLRLRAQTLRGFFAFARLNRLPVYRWAILYHGGRFFIICLQLHPSGRSGHIDHCGT